MNNDHKYTQFELVKEMMETSSIIRNFSLADTDDTVEAIRSAGKILLTGEGSSRIFPAKNAICAALAKGCPCASSPKAHGRRWNTISRTL